MKINYKTSTLYRVALNIYRFRHCFYNIGQEFWFFAMFKLCTYNLIWKREKVILLKHLNLYVKPNFFVITTLIEIFNHKLYKNLNNLDCVLDLWAYIGESAIYMSRNNKRVVAYEPSKDKYELLEKNIVLRNNIEGYNYAVVWDKDIKEMTFHQRDWFDFCSSSWEQKKLDKKVTVSCIDIQSVMSSNNFDGLKMDIEWWEYPLLKILMGKNNFPFKKWIIEFHFSGDNRNQKVDSYIEFHDFLINNSFSVRVFDNFNKTIESVDFENTGLGKKVLCLNIEFSKK